MSAFPYHLTEDSVAVDPHEDASVTKGGIHLPEVARRKPLQGTVVAVGPDVSNQHLKVGAVVVYGRYAGTELDLRVGDREILVLRAKDVRAVMQEPDAEHARRALAEARAAKKPAGVA